MELFDGLISRRSVRNYTQTLDFLFRQLPAFHRIGIAAYKNDLNNSIILDEYLGNPHHTYKTVHVAGTNGKGSVSHLIASILQEAGYRTGLYTSPHLKDFRERIKVNGEMIPEEDVVDFVEDHKEMIESLSPSFFEMTVAMAFEYFKKYKVDVAVVEVGLGGRLDSTNIIKPVLSVITNIGHDHSDLLGDTLAKIAFEKAGIIKEGIPVVIGESHQETKEIFISRANDCFSCISFADELYSGFFEDFNNNNPRKFILTEVSTGNIKEVETYLGGDYQLKNLITLFSAINELKNIFTISEANILDGIRNVVEKTGLNGRWQILNHDPLIICDTGHNMEGLKYVTDQLSRIHRSELHMVIGFMNDKDIGSVLPLFPKDAIYYFTRAFVPRALDQNLLMKEAEVFGLKGNSFPDVRTALEAARSIASKDDLIFIGGSTFIVAEVV